MVLDFRRLGLLLGGVLMSAAAQVHDNPDGNCLELAHCCLCRDRLSQTRDHPFHLLEWLFVRSVTRRSFGGGPILVRIAGLG